MLMKKISSEKFWKYKFPVKNLIKKNFEKSLEKNCKKNVEKINLQWKSW